MLDSWTPLCVLGRGHDELARRSRTDLLGGEKIMWNSSRTEVGLVLASLPRVFRTTGRQGFVYLHWNRIPLISGELGRTTTMCLIEHQTHGFGDQLSSPLYPFALLFLLRSSCACVTRRSSFHSVFSLCLVSGGARVWGRTAASTWCSSTWTAVVFQT